uniref:Uncharacterized protein n=1 Tax=Arundo donax TaxID=35708 RepID=A0A0A8ZKY7_ARUDO
MQGYDSWGTTWHTNPTTN